MKNVIQTDDGLVPGDRAKIGGATCKFCLPCWKLTKEKGVGFN